MIKKKLCEKIMVFEIVINKKEVFNNGEFIKGTIFRL